MLIKGEASIEKVCLLSKKQLNTYIMKYPYLRHNAISPLLIVPQTYLTPRPCGFQGLKYRGPIYTLLFNGHIQGAFTKTLQTVVREWAIIVFSSIPTLIFTKLLFTLVPSESNSLHPMFLLMVMVYVYLKNTCSMASSAICRNPSCSPLFDRVSL